MKVLVVCSYRTYISDGISPFIKEQVNALRESGIECEFYLVKGKGIFGYLKELPKLQKTIRGYKPNIVHAHFGLCGLLATIATQKIPVVVTYHGSDINNPAIYRYSKYAIRFSTWNVFVSPKNMTMAGCIDGKKASLVPCGVDDRVFKPMNKKVCREMLNLKEDGRYVLFTKMFGDPVKDYPLAKATIERIKDVELLEFTGYTREQSAMLMNAVDVILMTSKSEGSPQVIKEAMACGCPIVSVDVGDVKERIRSINGCYVAKTREPAELARLLQNALIFEGKTNGREVLMEQKLSNVLVAKRLVEIYERIDNIYNHDTRLHIVC